MIHNLIFDLGNVLVDIYPQQTVARLIEYCDPERISVESFFNDTLHLDYMAGKYSPDSFYETLVKRYSLRLDYAGFVRLWQQVIGDPKPGIEALIAHLQGRIQLSILSNTDPLHWNAAGLRLPCIAKFDQIFLSYEIGCNKPDSLIYEAALCRLDSAPQSCLFFDDIEVNVVAARKLGITAVQVFSTDTIVSTLRKFGWI